MKTKCSIRLPILFAVLCLLHPLAADAQIGKSGVRLKVVPDNSVVEEGRKYYQQSGKLHTVVDGRTYYIDRLNRITVGIPEPVIDPTGRFIFYASNTGCGFEAEGMTIFKSDIYGRKKSPILGRCIVLTPTDFLSHQNKHYLLIKGSSEGPDTDFWLYDIETDEFVLHADGDIKEHGKGQFTYGRADDESDFKEIGKVTTETLVRRAAPLRLLPRYPTHGLTLKPGVRVSQSDCYEDEEGPHKTIAKSGTRVLIVQKCEDGGYQVYFGGALGRVKKGAIKAIDFGQEK